MKSKKHIKRLVLRKETLRDLTAANAAGVKGGVKATRYGYGCTTPTYNYLCPTYIYMCPTVTSKPCHYTKGNPCH